MNALDHSLAWVHGERLEGAAIIALGVILMVSGGLLWKFGITPAARSMVLPLLLAGILITGICIVGEIRNFLRIDAFTQAHALDPAAFVAKEIARVEGFSKWYIYTFVAGSILIIGGLAAFLLVPAVTIKGIALTVIVIGTAALFIDYFSAARADVYLKQLLALGK